MKSFRMNNDGNMVMVAAFALPVALTAIGAALDLTNAHNHRQQVQAATDAAVLSVTLMPVTATDAERDAAALASITANTSKANGMLNIVDVNVTDITPTGGAPAFKLDVDFETKTTISHLIGVSKIDQSTAAKAQQTAGGTSSGVEIAMTMDVTASMTFPTKDGGSTSSEEAYAAIQAAMNQLDALSGSSDFYISFFPLADRINLGRDYSDWILFGNHEDKLASAAWTPADYGVIGWEPPAPPPAPPPPPPPPPPPSGEAELGDPLYRVAAGSGQLSATDGGMAWGRDKTGNKSPYLTNAGSNNSASTGSSINLTAVSGLGVPEDVFKTERWENSGGSEMQWSFPVDAGKEVEVRLYLAETWNGANGKNKRVFDVEVEGTIPPVFDDIDQWDLAGGMRKAIMLAHRVTSDGAIDLEFKHVIQNPAIKGIEIVNLTAPVASPPPPPPPPPPAPEPEPEATTFYDFDGFKPPQDDSQYFNTSTASSWNGCVNPRYLGDSEDFGLADNVALPYFLSDVPPEGEGGVLFRDFSTAHKYHSDSSKPKCNSQALIGPLHDTAPIFAALPGLAKAGTGRFDVAMAWAWRLLSPNWQGMWGDTVADPALLTYPENPASLVDPSDPDATIKTRRKVILMFTDGHTTAFDREFNISQPWGWNNLDPVHMGNLVAVCDAARSQGVEIYIFHVLGNNRPEVIQGFKDCVGTPENYAQDVEEYYHQIVTFEDLEIGLGAMSFEGVTSILTD